jgi:hypothetical protein
MSIKNHLKNIKKAQNWNMNEKNKIFTEPLDIITLLKYFTDTSNLFGSKNTTYCIACWWCIDVSETSGRRC